MVNYTLLYKDEETQVSYYYNLDDHAVYTDQRPADTKQISKFSFAGAGVAILIYPAIYLANTWHMGMPVLAGTMLAFVGFLLGWLVASLLSKSGDAYFIDENRLELTREEMKQMYLAGKTFRKKYVSLFVGLLVFTMICTVILCNTKVNTVLLLMLIVLWMLTGIMTFLCVLVCNRKIKKLMR